MSTFIENIRNRASSREKKIILPRSSDPRVVKAAEYLVSNSICDVGLILEKDIKLNDLHSGVDIIDPDSFTQTEQFAELLYSKRKHKGMSREEAEEQIKDPLYFAAAMVSSGHADGAVAGSVSSTASVLRAAIYMIGLKENTSVVSSVFMMSFDNGRVLTFGDCAVVPYPDAAQLSSIAISSAETHRKLTNEKPDVALLSFSTKGSAEHESIDKVRKALEITGNNAPELNIDGELQFDAAYLPSVGQRKAPDSKVAGKANVYIFPNLDAGNIAYKITERVGGATATGPVIQGLSKPMMDLSRGCSWEDIVNTACVCALMS